MWKQELHVELCDYCVDNQKVVWLSLDARHGWHGVIGFNHKRVRFIFIGLRVEEACICRDVILVHRNICWILAKIKRIFWSIFVIWWFWKFFDEWQFSWLEALLYG